MIRNLTKIQFHIATILKREIHQLDNSAARSAPPSTCASETIGSELDSGSLFAIQFLSSTETFLQSEATSAAESPTLATLTSIAAVTDVNGSCAQSPFSRLFDILSCGATVSTVCSRGSGMEAGVDASAKLMTSSCKADFEMSSAIANWKFQKSTWLELTYITNTISKAFGCATYRSNVLVHWIY